jgi:hypothetical protein
MVVLRFLVQFMIGAILGIGISIVANRIRHGEWHFRPYRYWRDK